MESLESSQNNQSVTDFDAPTSPVMEGLASAIVTTDASNDSYEPEMGESRPRPGFLRRRLPAILAGLVLGGGAVAASVYGYRWWQYSQQFKVTDNAYVAADMYQVESPVVGVVTEVSVTPNQEVKPGTALIKLDPREYQASLNQAKAALEASKKQVELAQKNLSAIANLSVPSQGTEAGTSPVVVPNLEQQRDLIQQQLQVAQATVAQKQAELKQAELKLSQTNILALAEGRVTNPNVQVGQRVQPGQSLMTIVKPNPWIIANFQENQFEKIQPGQPVKVRINAFPSQTFKGTVDGMLSTVVNVNGTTGDSQNNQSGKRIPFKIKLDPESLQGYESRITPQMSAIVTVDTKAKK
ncbi:HlyD family secretion protein [Calothrix sp. NIES-3974]|uniref:HlyD family secretion protein n=1 Tax=Calothrix sp. NIES-3974 TaxID=2005462 RepID=UPI000B5F7651|nr:HlyD family secretion protein [Calothrix sp. NIES-3974]BAZ03939.1 HlyD family secretion protein [Calothrix sp. NIES-3974]